MNLRNPEDIKTIEELDEEFRKVFLIADKGVIKITMATIIANRLPLDPVWLMLVAGPSGSKSEIISSLDGLDFIHSISDLTVNTFASGQRSAGKETSLLLKIGSGMLAFKDFTSVLSKNKDARKEILGQLREIFDGSYVKRTGTGEDISWSGKMGVIAGVTEVVYRFLEDLSAMGDRFILYTIEASDRIKASERNMEISSKKHELRQHLKSCVTNYIEYTISNLEDVDNIEISAESKKDILAVADFATRARSAVLVDFKTGKVDFVPALESPMRMVQQIYSLASAFVAMKRASNNTGLKGGSPFHDIDEEEKKILVKIAFDSIPRTRRDVLFLLATYKGGVRTAGIATKLNLPSDSVKKYLYEVNALELCSRKKFNGNGGDRWVMSDHYRSIMKSLLEDKLIIKDEELLGKDEEEEYLEDEWEQIPFDDDGNIPNEYVL
jgi:hypothetical protein